MTQFKLQCHIQSPHHHSFFERKKKHRGCPLDRFTKELFWNFKECQVVSMEAYHNKQMSEKKFFSNVAPSPGSGPLPLAALPPYRVKNQSCCRPLEWPIKTSAREALGQWKKLELNRTYQFGEKSQKPSKKALIYIVVFSGGRQIKANKNKLYLYLLHRCHVEWKTNEYK